VQGCDLCLPRSNEIEGENQMKKINQTHWILQEIAEERSPGKTINLWPQIELNLSSRSKERQIDAMTRDLKGEFSMRKALLYSTLLLVLLAFATTVFIPTVRAQVADWINDQTTVFTFLTPHSKVQVGLFSDGSLGFIPLSPTYLPNGDWVTVPDSYKDEVTSLDTLKLTINKDNQFVILTERKTLTGETLPVGKAVKVNDQSAVLFTGLSGEVDASIPLAKDGGVQPELSGQVNLNPIQYTDGVRLTWQMGEIRLEILSNLSLKQVLKIATSLQTVEAQPAQMATVEP
jgi:hypothetical protein